MKENISKKDSNIIILVFGIPFIILIGFMISSIFSGNSLNERIKMDNLSENVHGIIDSLYFDTQNHNVKFAIINLKQKFPINRKWERYIEVGDSISKNKNSFIVEIYKQKKTKIILDYRDTYKKK